MDMTMLFGNNKLQILRAVIISISVDVMNNFATKQLATDAFSSNDPMNMRRIVL